MGIKFVIQRNQNDELQHAKRGEQERWPAGTPGGLGGQWKPSDVSDAEYKQTVKENQRMAAELANRKMKKELNPPQDHPSVAAAKATNDIMKGVQNISNEVAKLPVESGTTTRGRYPNMSDKELQDKINRLNLENRYSDLVGDTKYTKSGSEKTREVFQTIGSVTGIVGSAALTAGTIVGIVLKLRGGSGKTIKPKLVK